MKLLAGLGVISMLVVFAACGGSEKPPLTPDQDNPGMSDGGADMPSSPAAGSAAPAAPTAPAK